MNEILQPNKHAEFALKAGMLLTFKVAVEGSRVVTRSPVVPLGNFVAKLIRERAEIFRTPTDEPGSEHDGMRYATASPESNLSLVPEPLEDQNQAERGSEHNLAPEHSIGQGRVAEDLRLAVLTPQRPRIEV